MNNTVTGIDSVELQFQQGGFPIKPFSLNLPVTVLYWIPPCTVIVKFHPNKIIHLQFKLTIAIKLEKQFVLQMEVGLQQEMWTKAGKFGVVTFHYSTAIVRFGWVEFRLHLKFSYGVSNPFQYNFGPPLTCQLKTTRLIDKNECHHFICVCSFVKMDLNLNTL